MFCASAERYRLFQYAVLICCGWAGVFWSSSAAHSSMVLAGVELQSLPIFSWHGGGGASMMDLGS